MNARGPILLLMCATLWGLAFVAQTTASDAIEPFTFNASRNFIGAVFLCGVVYARKRAGTDRPAGRRSGYSKKTFLVAGVSCGVLLCASSFLQQAGITAYPPEAAASGRSGFVTTTYMVMVAVIGLFSGKKPHPVVFASVAVAVVGMYLLCVPDGLENVCMGDWLVLASALGYALHIIVIDRFVLVDGVRLSLMQLIVSGVISLVCALVFEQPSLSVIIAAAIPIFYAGICSDGIAYTLQIVGQKSTDPTVASILLSLEAVFAAVGGWVILSESLGPVEIAGCALVFAAAMLAQVPEFAKAKKLKQAA